MAPETYAFGEFVLERGKHRLRRVGGETVVLAPLAFAALVHFLDKADELVERDELVKVLWPQVVVEDNNLSQVISSLRRALSDQGVQRRYIETVPRRGFRFIAKVRFESRSNEVAVVEPRSAATGARAGAPRLAVLPFVPIAADSRNELLELGMADSLIARLSSVPGLVVRSVGSLRPFMGIGQDPMVAARVLAVDWIVDGSLQLTGGRIRVSARLLSAHDGVACWSGRFDEAFTDVFAIQDLISSRVAEAMVPQLAPHARTSRVLQAFQGDDIGASRNADAYQMYLAARQHAQGVRGDGLKSSLDLYEKALRIDPNYALAYAGLGETYRRMLFGADGEPHVMFRHYRRVVLRALELAPGLPDAHAQLGWIHFWYDFEWDRAEAVFRRALAINSNVVSAHFGLGFLLVTLDRVEEGLHHVQLARELDPLSLIINTMEATFLDGVGRHDDARSRMRRVLEIEPNFWVAHMALATFDLRQGAWSQALVHLARAESRSSQSTQARALTGFALARAGRLSEARTVLEKLRELRATRYVPHTSLAAIEAASGRTEQALTSLEHALDARDTRMAYIKDDPRWTTLRTEPRFIALLERLGLSVYGAGVAGP